MTILAEALTSAGYSVKQAAVWTPGWLAFSVVIELLMALNPAIQVQLVAQLVRAVDDDRHGVWLPLILLSFFVGLALINGSLMGILAERSAIALVREYQKQLLWAITELPPQRLATEEVNANIQACRGAIWDVSVNERNAISAASAIIGAAALCFSVWTIDPLAGVLVVIAVLPTIVASSWTAIAEDKQWPLIGEFERKKGYYQEQLVFARTGTELATLGSGVRMARLTDDAQVERNRLFGRLLRTYMISGVLAGAVTAALIAGALASIVLGGGGGAGIAAGTLGVIAGVAAIRMAGYSYGSLMTDAPKVTRFRAFIDSIEPHEPSVVVPVVHELRAADLQVTYPTKTTPALAGFSFSVRRGETIAFVGVNGAGKTTAVNALLGIVDTDDGEIAIDGRDVAGMTRFERLGYFGLLTQEFGRYELTVRESVALGTPDLDVSDERIWAALDAARAGDLVRSLPGGLDAQLGTQWGGTGLSGGQ